MEPWQPTLSDGTDETEQLGTVQKSCCFCIPPSIGIIVLALIKLVLSLGLLLLLTDALHMSYLFGHPILLHHIMIWIAISLDLVDVAIAMVVVISVCVKNQRIMKMYYIYSICIFGALTFICCVIVYIITGNLVFLLIFIFIFFLMFMMQEYLNYLLKSEVTKLENSEQFRL